MRGPARQGFRLAASSFDFPGTCVVSVCVKAGRPLRAGLSAAISAPFGRSDFRCDPCLARIPAARPAAAPRERRRPRDPFPASPHIAAAGDPTNRAAPERPPNRP